MAYLVKMKQHGNKMAHNLSTKETKWQTKQQEGQNK